jgi:hypothetical protein
MKSNDDNPLFHPYAINIKDKSMIERWMLRMTNRFSYVLLQMYLYRERVKTDKTNNNDKNNNT